MIGSSEPTCSEGGGAVEADIGDQVASQRLLVEPREIGTLMDEAALEKRARKSDFGLKSVIVPSLYARFSFLRRGRKAGRGRSILTPR